MIDDEPTSEAWLEGLRRRGWEMELLLTGFVLVGLFQVPDLLSTTVERWTANVPVDSAALRNIIGLGYRTVDTSARIVTLDLLALLVLRGAWIGLIGLDSAFPSGIRIDRLDPSERFARDLQGRPRSLESTIRKLDRICSSIFSFTFLIVSMAVSVGLFMVYLFAIGFLGELVQRAELSEPVRSVATVVVVFLGMVHVLAGVLVVVDFFGLGALKRVRARWFSTLYFHVSRAIGTITLAFVSRPIHHVLVTNLPRRVVRAALVGFLTLVVVILVGVDYDEHIYVPRPMHSGPRFVRAQAYENLSPEVSRIMNPVISSDVVTEQVVRLFIPYRVSLNPEIRERCGDVDAYRTPLSLRYLSFGETVVPSEQVGGVVECFEELYEISVDDGPPLDLEFHLFRHPHAGEPGVIAYVPMRGLTSGRHVLSVEPVEGAGSEEAIVFWYDGGP